MAADRIRTNAREQFAMEALELSVERSSQPPSSNPEARPITVYLYPFRSLKRSERWFHNVPLLPAMAAASIV